MIGPKKLSEVESELFAAFRKRFKDPVAWLDRRIRRLEMQKNRNPTEVEGLEMIRNTLARQAAKLAKHVKRRQKVK